MHRLDLAVLDEGAAVVDVLVVIDLEEAAGDQDPEGFAELAPLRQNGPACQGFSELQGISLRRKDVAAECPLRENDQVGSRCRSAPDASLAPGAIVRRPDLHVGIVAQVELTDGDSHCDPPYSQ